MRDIVYIQDTDEKWECEGNSPLENGEIFSLDCYEEGILVEEKWLKVVEIIKDTESGQITYNTIIANVPWAKNK